MIDKDKLLGLKKLVDASEKIIVILADNIDEDSLSSAVALQDIFGQINKEVFIYSAVKVPKHLQFIKDWDRVGNNIPKDPDFGIVVDCSSNILRNILKEDPILKEQTKRGLKLIVIDHHSGIETMPEVDLMIDYDKAVATGQIIYQLAVDLDWPLNKAIADNLAIGLLTDSLWLMAQEMTDNPEPLRVMAELVELGANLAKIRDKSLNFRQMSKQMVAHQGQLLQEINWLADGKIALLEIEMNTEAGQRYIDGYNPSAVLNEVKFVKGVRLSLGFKKYQKPNQSITSITVRIRCYGQKPGFANQLAVQFGGGGHAYAAGIVFRGNDLDYNKIKHNVCQKAIKIIGGEQ